MMHHFSAMKTLKDLNFESWTEWKTDLQIFLGLWDLDIALYKEKPTDASEYERWEKSNRLSILIMKAKTDGGIRGLVHDSTGNAKQFDGEGSVCEHIMKMASIYSRLRAVNFMGLSDDSFLVEKAVNSLPQRFRPLQSAYDRQNKNFGLDELISRCVAVEKLFNEVEDNDVSDASFEREQSGYRIDNDCRKSAKTQCFSCGEIGHKRRDCPN